MALPAQRCFGMPAGVRSPGMRPKVLLTILSIAWLLFGVWFVATPFLSVWSLERAAAAGDAEGISEHVDFPALRESIRANTAQRIRGIGSALPAGPLAELGTNLATALASSAVDTIVTPETVAMMMRGMQPGTTAPASTPLGEFDLSMGYSALNRFVVEARAKDSTSPPVQLIFTRSGFASWRLTSVRDPSLSTSG